MQQVEKFKVESIDGCEFVRSAVSGKAIISQARNFFGVSGKSIRIMFPDSSYSTLSADEAQLKIDSGEWTVLREMDSPVGQKDKKSLLY